MDTVSRIEKLESRRGGAFVRFVLLRGTTLDQTQLEAILIVVSSSSTLEVL